MLPITDADRAKAFYADALGLSFEGLNVEGSLMFRLAGEASLGLMTRPAGTQSQHTAISFEVSDIAGVIKELEAAGVAFQDYDTPELKTENHVCVLGPEKAAWFLDPDGNVLCLHEDSGS